MRPSRWKPSSACALTEAVAASPLQADLQGVLDCVDARVWEALRGRSIFVTGGTGFVGSWLVEALLQARKNHAPGLSVTVLSRDPEAFLGAYPQLAADAALRLHRGDVASFTFVKHRATSNVQLSVGSVGSVCFFFFCFATTEAQQQQ